MIYGQTVHQSVLRWMRAPPKAMTEKYTPMCKLYDNLEWDAIIKNDELSMWEPISDLRAEDPLPLKSYIDKSE